MTFLSQFEKPEFIFRTKLVFKNLTRTACVSALTQRCRKCSTIRQTDENQSFFVTTPIFYVNAAPHMGHLYTCVLADAVARYHSLKGKQILFSTGTDEHGLKIQQAAERHKKPPAEFTTSISSTFKEMFDCYNINYTDYIRTTEERHYVTVQKFWRELETRGCIYKGSYEGWYSVSDEAFLSENDVKTSVNEKGQVLKVSAESGHPVTWMQEDNYMFRLSDYKDKLREWFDTGVIEPPVFEPTARRWLSSLEDLSVSRPCSRLSWGIPVPGDNSQTIYVWLDALVNYLTVCGYPSQGRSWPADVQVIGKDILKFHAIYWPAFLMAAGLDPPRKIFCHSHWLINGAKMSKSLGNVVDPMIVQEKYSAEVFRYYLLREGVPHSDGNFLEEKAMEYVNSDVVNTMGNLLSRCTAPAINPSQIYPRKYQETYISKITASDRETFENLDMLIDTVEGYYKDMMFYRGIESIMSYLRWANGVVQQHEVWNLAKSDNETDIQHLKCVIHVALETLRVSGILLQPVIPNISQRLLNRLGIPKDRRTFECAKKPYLNSPELALGPNEGVILKRLKIIK
ncbi:methionine--tRNA ligase, mitochondrial-like [Mercenaria mercenaria]|uniref:methionine--tRNA ligase, mitochondrial-like n=1 Tax=Mercenaria mercenaria TaxID=6596 RepID=UPI00234F210B|nr:methionine--tRNA ligase, mitochondrial-like [Mercenaria mercenaria]